MGALAPGGELILFLSEIDRPTFETVVERLGERGFKAVDVREATESDVAELSSGWARRLGIARSRPGWVARLQSVSAAESADRPLAKT